MVTGGYEVTIERKNQKNDGLSKECVLNRNDSEFYEEEMGAIKGNS